MVTLNIKGLTAPLVGAVRYTQVALLVYEQDTRMMGLFDDKEKLWWGERTDVIHKGQDKLQTLDGKLVAAGSHDGQLDLEDNEAKLLYFILERHLNLFQTIRELTNDFTNAKKHEFWDILNQTAYEAQRFSDFTENLKEKIKIDKKHLT